MKETGRGTTGKGAGNRIHAFIIRITTMATHMLPAYARMLELGKPLP
jgi:hypothetical protein